MRLSRVWTLLGGVFFSLLFGAPLHANQDDLQSLVNSKDTEPAKSLVLNPNYTESRYHLAAGVSYTGLQLRYQFSTRWSAEARAQFGTASSNYGDVKATVVSLRGYRFIPYRRNLSWYLGGEVGHANAKADHVDYEVDGFVAGAFMGVEYRLLPRVAIGMDIGPYAISLKEKQTQTSQNNLDFVVNTAINFYLF